MIKPLKADPPEDVIARFIAERSRYITAIENCPSTNADYWRWQGHAEARRQLAQALGINLSATPSTGGPW